MGLKTSKTLAAAKKTLDREFSKWVRTRTADQYGMVRCVTCTATGHWKSMDAGHYVPRKHHAVRWDEMNCHPQCRNCNRVGSGMMASYSKFMFYTYGEEAVLELEAKGREIKQFTKQEVMELAQHFHDLATNNPPEKSPYIWNTNNPHENITDSNPEGSESNEVETTDHSVQDGRGVDAE